MIGDIGYGPGLWFIVEFLPEKRHSRDMLYNTLNVLAIHCNTSNHNFNLINVNLIGTLGLIYE